MNKVFALVLCLTATVSAGVFDGQLSLQGQESYIESAKERLAMNMQQICEDKSDTEIEEAIRKLVDCAVEIEIESYTFCHLMKTEVPRCVQHVTSFLDECLPERSHGLPNLILDSFNASITYMCGTDGEHLLEVVANPCIYNRPSYKLNRCKNRVVSKLQRYKNQTPTKNEVCEALTSLKPCLLAHIEESCGNAITREAYIALFNAALKPCANNSNNEIEEIELIYRK